MRPLTRPREIAEGDWLSKGGWEGWIGGVRRAVISTNTTAMKPEPLNSNLLLRFIDYYIGGCYSYLCWYLWLSEVQE